MLASAENRTLKKPPAEAGDKLPERTGCELPAREELAIQGVLGATKCSPPLQGQPREKVNAPALPPSIMGEIATDTVAPCGCWWPPVAPFDAGRCPVAEISLRACTGC